MLIRYFQTISYRIDSGPPAVFDMYTWAHELLRDYNDNEMDSFQAINVHHLKFVDAKLDRVVTDGVLSSVEVFNQDQSIA